MGNYLVGFSVYTLAMIGIIFVGFLVVKKCSMARRGAKSHNNFLEVETSLSLEPRKTIHVIRAGSEKILLATDAENTTFLTKLGASGEFSVETLPKQVVNETKYCSKPKEIDQFDFEDCFPKEEDQPKVFKDLMKRLQQD